MAKTLLLGLGGTGARVVNNVARMLRENGKAINQGGEFCCAVLDTNENDNNDIIATGIGVPVIPTSKAQTIADYFADYQYLHMEDWCPQSPALMEQSMIDGASELRVKSRIAFMDCLATGELDDLEMMINEVLRTQVDSKIRIMIVSSLSGGTGSGMFIQVALWLREHLQQQQITIRGIFLLPDVFIETIEDIKKNATSTARHYANAYAAIRELNAISKIRNNGTFTPSEPIRLDSLFDSDTDKDKGKPVFDYVFFVDYKDQNGVFFGDIKDYERFVAQLVYMQMYAPMKNDMYSEEDNTFLAFSKSDDPLYGSCGTAKAEYPVASVITYCTLRGAQDSLTKGWRYIDSEIKAKQDERKEREKDGIYSKDAFDVPTEYIKIFDRRASVKPDKAGSDRFFLTIGHDIHNEEMFKDENGKVLIRYTDKVSDFLDRVTKQKINTMANTHGGLENHKLNKATFTANHKTATTESLLALVNSHKKRFEETLDDFDREADNYAEEIVSELFPYNMGEVSANESESIFGLLTKEDRTTGNRRFIHPVAARYVLYKLVREMEQKLKGVALKNSRADALSGGSNGEEFDNPATKKVTERDAAEMLSSKKRTQNEDKFRELFFKGYVQFNEKKIGLCSKYENELLQVKVYQKLIPMVNGLSDKMKAFFDRLEDVSDKISDDLTKNRAETAADAIKTLYVLGKADQKERLYQRLDLETETADAEISKSVIYAVYGRLCAEKRPSAEANKTYANFNVATVFLQQLLQSFRDRINIRENLDLVDLDLYTALCLESDFDAEKAKGLESDATDGGLDALNVNTGEISADNSVAQRHAAAFRKLKKTLDYMSAPFLIYDREPTTDAMGAVITRKKEFWGFHPSLVDAYPNLGNELGINADLQADSAYRPNELYCYRAVYGLAAQYIPKFNENSGGMYYKCYSALIDSILRDLSGVQGERAYVQTPHLDYNWHRILPYVTPDKDKTDELAFYHGLWLAVAYGKLRADKNGNAMVRRTIDTGFGSSANDDIPVRYNGRAVACKDASRLVEAMRLDKTFLTADIPELEARYSGELDIMDTYVGTEVMKGLMGASTALHPVDLICRYHEGRDTDKYVEALLIGALEKIAEELAEKYNKDRSEEKLEEAKFRICRKIYDSSQRVSGKEDVFSHWTEVFGRLNIKGETAKK